MGKFKENKNKVYQTIRDFLIRERIRDIPVAVALSGGADSVCLLMGLLHWRDMFHVELSALHVQHNLRGAESFRDEQFCRDLCKTMEIPLQVVSVDVRDYQKSSGISSLETAARKCRYDAFEAHRPENGLIATAHTASDNLETILFRLARGTGLKGLCGIPPRRDYYIRPLLEITRSEIELFLEQQNQDYVTDSSNLQEDYTRNFIRHRIVPLLKRITGSPEKSGIMLTDLLRQEEDFLEISAHQAYQACFQPTDNSLRGLKTLHPALQRRCIKIYLEHCKIRADYQNIILVQNLLQNGGHAELVRGLVTARVSQGILCLEEKKPSSGIPEQNFRIFKIPANFNQIKDLINYQIFENSVLSVEFIRKDRNPEKFTWIVKKFPGAVLDYDKISVISAQGREIILHGRKPGLYLRLPGREHRIWIQKWLQTLPVSERTRIHYLSDESGHLLWVERLGSDPSVSITDHTRHILFLDVHNPDTEST
ncbi:MAG: tRNA lysidine(34) synthetase TilS [Oscillospiraceae bacterium]|nr:tRNA lysidine(34) synthetase TilS [Oscillospiraceae bacterium]